jgi:hypothetical protein
MKWCLPNKFKERLWGCVYQVAGLYVEALLGHAGGDQQVDVAPAEALDHLRLLPVVHIVAAADLGCTAQ